MSTSHEILNNVIGRNQAVQAETQKLARYLVQRGLPNTAIALADQSVGNVTLVASTYLQIVNSVGYNSGFAVVGGRTYKIDGYFPVAGSAGGVKVAMDGGTATATNVQLTYEHYTAAAVAVTDSAAFATTAGAATAGMILVRVTGTFLATGSGSIGLRFSEVTNATTSVLKKGASLSLTEIAQAAT